MKANTKYDKRKSTFQTPDTSIVKHAVCAVSGGMDSVTCLFHAIKLYGKENVIGVSLYYGQRNDIELVKAKAECDKLGVKYIEINITPIFSINKNISSLLKGSDKEITQDKSYCNLTNEKKEKNEIPISDEYIPNRNSLFLNIICSIGLQQFNNSPIAVITGIHSDPDLKSEGKNATAYPDTSIEFSDATNNSLQLATGGLCYVYSPLANKTKEQVAEFGIENGMTKEDFNNTWSCYKGLETKRKIQCGKCPACIDRINGLINSKVFKSIKDITENYELTEEEASKYLNLKIK